MQLKEKIIKFIKIWRVHPEVETIYKDKTKSESSYMKSDLTPKRKLAETCVVGEYRNSAGTCSSLQCP